MGIIIWGGITILNIIVFSIIARPKTWPQTKINKILLAAFISDIIVHIVALMSGDPWEMLAWSIISFPFVGILSLLIILITKYLYILISKKLNRQ